MPPFASSVPRENMSYKASPLARTLTPPAASALAGLPPFPPMEVPPMHNANNNKSIDSTFSQSSNTSGHNFHIPSSGLSLSNSSDPATSPTYYPQSRTSSSASIVQIYCGNCRRLNNLKDCYACTECISGFCSDCVYTLSSAHGGRPRVCPRCRIDGPRYKPFQLDLR